MELLNLPGMMVQNLHIMWTFVLLVIRFSALLMVLPGIGMGERGMPVRMPAVLVFAVASTCAGVYAPMPPDVMTMVLAAISEVMLGFILGLIPLLIVTGVQIAGQLASTTMGLGAGNLMDPTLGINASDFSRLLGDLVIILFLLSGGHHIIIHAVAGLSGTLVPGSYLVDESSLRMLVARTGDIFEIGILLSAPVVVALLLTQFMMGLVSRAVPTVNIFIVSFPLTIGIGMIISILALPDMITFIDHQLVGVEGSVMAVMEDVNHGQ